MDIEQERISVVESYEIFNSLPEKEYDEITQLASFICDTPISLLTFINKKKQFFKSHHGLNISETPLEYSFCKHVHKHVDELFVVPNALEDDRFKDNPFVTNDANIIFYAGHPITDANGVVIASICVIDHQPKELSEGQVTALKSLSNQVSHLLELRKNRIDLLKSKEEITLKTKRLENIIESTNAGTYEWNVQTNEITLNKTWGELIGLDINESGNLSVKEWKDRIHPDDKRNFNHELKKYFKKKSDHFDLEYRMKHKNDSWVWIHDKGKIGSWTPEKEPLMMIGTHADITRRKLIEQKLSALTDNIPGVVFSFKQDKDEGYILSYASKGYLDIWGTLAEKAMKDNSLIWNYVLDEDVPRVKESLKRSAAEMSNWKVDWRMRLEDGTIKWHRGIGKPNEYKKGRVSWDAIILDITEEKLILESLRERNHFIEKTLDNLPIGIAVNKVDSGKATIMNKKFSEIYGWPVEELSDIEAFFEKIYPDKTIRKEIKERITTDILSGDMDKMVWEGIKIRRKDGEERIINAKNIPLPDQNLMISTVIDVTDNYLNEAAILEYNERFKLASKATSDTLWDWDIKADKVVRGENFEVNFGYKIDELYEESNKFWEKQLHPDDHERAVNGLHEALEGSGSTWIEEYRFKKSDGDYLQVMDRAFIVRDSVGTAIRMVGAMQDITQQKNREQQLRLFESVIEKTNDTVIITEAEPFDAPNGPKIIYVNEAFTRHTGYSKEEVVGNTPRMLQGPKSDKKVLKQLGKDLRAWKKIDVDVLNYTKDREEFWVNLSMAPVADEKGWFTHWISIQKDITETKNKELYQNLVHEVSKVFTLELDLKTSLDSVLQLLLEFGHFNVAEAWLVNSEKNKINLVRGCTSDLKFDHCYGHKAKINSLDKGMGLAGLTWEKEELQFWPNLAEIEEFNGQLEAKRSGLETAFGIPILFNDQVIGAVILYLDDAQKTISNRHAHLTEFGSYFGSEIARKQLEEELNQIINFTPDFICSLDQNGVFKRINPALNAIINKGSKPKSQLKFIDVIHEDDKEKALSSLQNLIDSEESILLELRCVDVEGNIVWVSWTITPAVEHGIAYCVGKDITSSKEAIEKMKISNERFSKVVEATQDAIWDWDVINNKVFWGNGFFERFGHDIDSDTISIKTWSLLVHKDDQERVFKMATDSLKEVEVANYQNKYRFQKSDGTYAYVIDHARILRDDEGRPIRVIGALQDISDRKLYEDSLKKLNRKLKNKAKQLEISNSELEQFAYVTSHDLQEPLRMITSFLSLLESKYKDSIDDKGRKYIHYAVDGAKRMREIILELLDYSRVGNSSEKLETIAIHALLNEVLLLHKKQITESKAIITIGEMPQIVSFKSPLRQIFLNLIGNGLKYKKPGTVPEIVITCEEEKLFWKFSVKDNGIGIAPEYFEKIFIIFQRLHTQNEFGGVGMGLAITKKIVNNLGGKIWVNSDEGQGSTFVFTIKKNE
ncbi:PAS domain-containing protein [Sediminicola sp. 1XM1-17]|uniref:PAS domain-containing protein n=1 Tax=Sediminicola sp. 1XM1-17 TaxID=3127702 RepID=UPI003077DCE3